MGVKDFIFARLLSRGREPEAADMVLAKKLVGGGGGGGTGPFLALPKFGSKPTAADVLSYGVQLGDGSFNYYLAATSDIYYFRIRNDLIFASVAAGDFYSQFSSSGSLRTWNISGRHTATGLYYLRVDGFYPYATVYECASLDAGLAELAQYI